MIVRPEGRVAVVAFMVTFAGSCGFRLRAGQWASAAIDAAVSILLIYISLRDLRRSKGT